MGFCADEYVYCKRSVDIGGEVPWFKKLKMASDPNFAHTSPWIKENEHAIKILSSFYFFPLEISK